MDILVKDIELSIGRNNILKGASIEVGKKEFIGIIGPNGSGKSTFLKCIYRISKPDKGCIFLDNEHLNRMSIKESAKKWL